MCIDADGLLAKGVAQNNIGGFSADARKAKEIFQPLGYSAIKALDDFGAAVVNGARLVAVEVDLAQLFLQLLQRYSRIVFGRSIFFKQIDGDLVYQIVPRLGGQN